ncbi:hypothetical protein AAFF_G00046390 [Aldrovandia affinis]|uniref:Gypsy retrotransposon integrase-like protein 1 n=1 Tax=Aldrovandia affinis TaxID=143900 RepID=A0AAD7S213_9TELE|nr:hypothetical protein AAFF_G00046390 [Aldrovandia affinis]
MPTRVQVALANTTITEPRALAEEADRFFLATQRPSPDLLAPTISAPPPVYRTAARDNSMPPDQRGATAGLCFYHSRFGTKAKQCRSPATSIQRKREGRRSVVALSAGDSSRLLFIRDTISNRRFLCDTGAQRERHSRFGDGHHEREHGPQLATADSSPIRSYGVRSVELCFGGQRFIWDFVVASIAFHLLGADFLCAHGLLVDMKNNCLVDAQTFTSFACTRGEAVYSGLSSLLSEEDQYLRLLAEFPDLTQPTFSAPTVKHGVEHHIDTKGPPVYARRLDPACWPSLKRSSRTWSRWASSAARTAPGRPHIHIVAKPGGGWRPCGDYRRLNDATTPDRYPVPHIQDFSAHLSDDILIASATEEEHLSHLRALFTRLSQRGLIVNPAKCLFGRGTIEFLGHRVTCEGAVPLPSKVEAVAAFPRPLTARSLREFIRMAAMLTHPSHTAPIAITTDASDYAVGAVYEQWVGGAWQPLAFFSRQLSPSERKYSTFDRELLGLWLAIRHFRFLLEGREFTAYVDHKPLTFAMSKAAEPWSARQQRQFSFISEFTTDIQHVAGKSNQVADCLSRAVVGAVQLGLDYSHMATDQASDPTVQTLKTMDTGLRLEEVAFGDTGATLLCDISTGQPRPVVPVSWRRPVFEAVHGLSHPGRKPSVRLVAAKFVWHGLRKDVKAWVDTCTACQRAKVHRHIKAPLERFSVPERRFDHVNVDLVGPLPPSHGYTYLFTMVDRTTRWPEAVPSLSTTSADLARHSSGRGSSGSALRLTSPLTAARSSLRSCGVLWRRAWGLNSTYHPQANGLCERFHRSMKAALRASLKDGNWLNKLPWVMLGLRTAPKEDLQSSSAELVYGAATAGSRARVFAPVPTTQHSVPTSQVPPGLRSAGYVFIRHDAHRGPLQPPYDGPFRVLEHGPKHLVVDIGAGGGRYYPGFPPCPASYGQESFRRLVRPYRHADFVY